MGYCRTMDSKSPGDLIAVISSELNAHKPAQHDRNLYAMRNIVERFFCKMKDMRSISTT